MQIPRYLVSTDWLWLSNQRPWKEKDASEPCSLLSARKWEDTQRIIGAVTVEMKRGGARCKTKETNVPLSMLIPILRRSRRHLVASIHASSLSPLPALSLGSGHALSPPLHTREQHHHYCKWQLAGGGRGGGARPALNFISSRCWMRVSHIS